MLAVIRSGAAGFIGWLDLLTHSIVAEDLPTVIYVLCRKGFEAALCEERLRRNTRLSRKTPVARKWCSRRDEPCE
jgi:hypothetical protein